MNKFYTLALTVLAACSSLASSAQCSFTPTVMGNDRYLCPDDGMFLSTETYDSYQWYSRSSYQTVPGDETPIPVQTQQMYYVTYGDVPAYISVEVTKDGCTTKSEEVLVDSWAALGELWFVYEGPHEVEGYPRESEVTMAPSCRLIIDTHPEVTWGGRNRWYKDDVALPEFDNGPLTVRESGTYKLETRPKDCPNLSQHEISRSIDVLIDGEGNLVCDVSVQEIEAVEWNVYPNPAEDVLNIQAAEELDLLRIYNSIGQKVYEESIAANVYSTTVDLSSFEAGLYSVEILVNNQKMTKRVYVK